VKLDRLAGADRMKRRASRRALRELVSLPDGRGDARPGVRRVIRGTAAYALASIVQRSLAFLLLPLYARVLTPAEFGQISIIVTIAAAVGTTLGLGLETAMFRTWVGLRDQLTQRERFVNTVGGFGLLFPLLVSAVVAVPLAVAVQSTFHIAGAPVALGILGAGVTASMTTVPLALLRASERLGAFVRLGLLQALLSTTLTLLLVAGLGWGVLGWMIAATLSSAVILAVGMALLGHRWTSDFDVPFLRAGLMFGLPLVPHAMSHWGLALSDRVILGALIPTSAVGVYHVAYQLGLPITLIGVALSQSVQPLFAEASTRPEKRHEIERLSTQQVVTLGMLTMAVGLLGPPVIHGALPAEYLAAVDYVPWIAVGAGLFGMYLIPMNAIAVMTGHSRWVWVCTVVAVAANVSLNLTFVPIYGAMAAAVSTAIAYGVLLGGVYILMLRICQPPLAFEWRRIARGLGVIASIWILALVMTSAEPWLVQLVIRCGLILVAAAALIASGTWLVLPRDALRLLRGRRSTED
jgi:O-antigen/teichoic acid export membrane protein